MGYTGGSDLNQLGDKSLMRLVTEFFVYPRAADTDYFVASVDPSTLTVGTACSLATLGAAGNIDYARRVTLRIVDASYSANAALSVTVRITGQRNGQLVTEDLTATATSGAAVTTTSSKLFDQVTQVLPLILSNTASGDDLQVGISGAALGLKYGIRSVTDVVSIIEWDSGTPQTPLTISSTYVDPTYDCIQGLTLAVTDIWKVTYIARDDAGIGSSGVFP